MELPSSATKRPAIRAFRNRVFKIFDCAFDVVFPKKEVARELETMSENELRKWAGWKDGAGNLLFFSPANTRDGVIGKHYSLLRYKDSYAQDAIIELKYRKNERIARLLGAMFATGIQAVAKTERLDTFVIMPIPASPARLRERGYNQVALMLAKSGLLGVRTDVLIKIKETPSQTEKKDRDARLANPRGCFAVNPAQLAEVRSQTIVLVDDVLTTGATLEEARKALIEAGAARVITVALAH